ncbi:MAG TPA: cytochrome c3 family protein, partial [Planctomycetota bacterium]|nr:cytochrome c3 family protein [Planctomycetota bacterium]
MILAALAIGGCVGGVRFATAPTGFDHAGHGKRDLACTDCHAGAKTAAEAGMPPVTFCTDCHDPSSNVPKRIQESIESLKTSLAVKAYPGPSVKGPTYGDVKFDHAKHAKANVECATCHPGVATPGPTNPNPEGPLSMQQCVSCHKEKGASTDCATCHAVIRKDQKPPSHERDWIRQHGPISRVADRTVAAERCDTCHSRSSCDECHQREAPRDHGESWRVATHGLQASMDRTRCLACHR